MRSQNILCASLVAAALALPLSSAARANVVISIDKSTQHMTVSVDGTARYEWPVSTGRRGYDTPNGTFKPNRMEAEHFSKEYEDAPMPHSIFFDMDGHAIHGFFDIPHLGMAVSHGCVRLSPAHAATLFDLVKTEAWRDTIVVVAGRIPGRRRPRSWRGGVPPPRKPRPNSRCSIAPAYGQQPAPYSASRPTASRPMTETASPPSRNNPRRSMGSRLTGSLTPA